MASDLDGGVLDSVQTFNAADKKYKFAGADRDGFIKDSQGVYRYYNAAGTIVFDGTMDFNTTLDSEAAANKFTLQGSTVYVSDDLFSPYNNTGDTLTVSEGNYTLSGESLTAAGEIVTADLAAKDGGYTFKTAGSKDAAGYTDNNGVVTYYALSKDLNLNGSLKLDDTADSAVTFGYDTVEGSNTPVEILTIGNAALVAGEGTLTLEGSSYKLALGSDVTDTWAYVDESLSANQLYNTAGYSEDGFGLEGNVISYHSVSSATVQFGGLASAATKDDITLDGNSITLSASAIAADGTAASIVGESEFVYD